LLILFWQNENLPEAGAELVFGYNVEYSAMGLDSNISCLVKNIMYQVGSISYHFRPAVYMGGLYVGIATLFSPFSFIITAPIMFLYTQGYLLISFIMVGGYALIVRGITAFGEIAIGIGREYGERQIQSFWDAVGRAGTAFIRGLGQLEGPDRN